MTIRGQIENGQIRIDEESVLSKGARVTIEIAEGKSATIWDRLRALAGAVEGPEDGAANHDHYIHGTPTTS